MTSPVIVPSGVFAPGYGVHVPGGNGNVPVLWASGLTIPEAWRNAMFCLGEHGIRVPTSFDVPEDPLSWDATVGICVLEPFREPKISKLFPGGMFELENYRLEVCYGIHDHWINRGGKEWNYTYHERLYCYEWNGVVYNQVEGLIEQLKAELADPKQQLFRRRFQLTTWIPEIDQHIVDPPCLQRIHLRFVQNPDGSWTINVNTNWRSRDGFLAWYMNVYAIVDFIRLLAMRLTDETGVQFRVGRYYDESDSLHIYGKNLEGVGGYDAVIGQRARNTPLEELVWTTGQMADMFVEARHTIAAQLHSEHKLGAGKAVVHPSIAGQVATWKYPDEWDQ